MSRPLVSGAQLRRLVATQALSSPIRVRHCACAFAAPRATCQPPAWLGCDTTGESVCNGSWRGNDPLWNGASVPLELRRRYVADTECCLYASRDYSDRAGVGDRVEDDTPDVIDSEEDGGGVAAIPPTWPAVVEVCPRVVAIFGEDRDAQAALRVSVGRGYARRTGTAGQSLPALRRVVFRGGERRA
jgi:hypothetical protein